MQELQGRVQGARYFTKMDLKNGFNLIRMKAGVRGRKKHVHSKEGSTGHLYKCPCTSASV